MSLNSKVNLLKKKTTKNDETQIGGRTHDFPELRHLYGPKLDENEKKMDQG